MSPEQPEEITTAQETGTVEDPSLSTAPTPDQAVEAAADTRQDEPQSAEPPWRVVFRAGSTKW